MRQLSPVTYCTSIVAATVCRLLPVAVATPPSAYYGTYLPDSTEDRIDDSVGNSGADIRLKFAETQFV